MDPRLEPTLHAQGYVLTGVVGRGGIGEVFTARELASGDAVAVKALHTEDPEQERRFLREAHLALRLRHEHLVRGIAVHEGPPSFFVMELIPVPSVLARAASGDLFSEDEALEILRQTSSALTYLHANAVIHRDVKPANLLFCPERTHTWLCDLGVARDLDASRLTATGQAPGTLTYVAPEIFSGEKAGPAVDAYGLGATLYAALTGFPPFAKGRDTYSVIRRIVNEAPFDVRRRRPELSRELAETIHALLEKRPEDRPSLAALSGD